MSKEEEPRYTWPIMSSTGKKKKGPSSPQRAGETAEMRKRRKSQESSEKLRSTDVQVQFNSLKNMRLIVVISDTSPDDPEVELPNSTCAVAKFLEDEISSTSGYHHYLNYDVLEINSLVSDSQVYDIDEDGEEVFYNANQQWDALENDEENLDDIVRKFRLEPLQQKRMEGTNPQLPYQFRFLNHAVGLFIKRAVNNVLVAPLKPEPSSKNPWFYVPSKFKDMKPMPEKDIISDGCHVFFTKYGSLCRSIQNHPDCTVKFLGNNFTHILMGDSKTGSSVYSLRPEHSSHRNMEETVKSLLYFQFGWHFKTEMFPHHSIQSLLDDRVRVDDALEWLAIPHYDEDIVEPIAIRDNDRNLAPNGLVEYEPVTEWDDTWSFTADNLSLVEGPKGDNSIARSWTEIMAREEFLNCNGVVFNPQCRINNNGHSGVIHVRYGPNRGDGTIATIIGDEPEAVIEKPSNLTPAQKGGRWMCKYRCQPYIPQMLENKTILLAQQTQSGRASVIGGIMYNANDNTWCTISGSSLAAMTGSKNYASKAIQMLESSLHESKRKCNFGRYNGYVYRVELLKMNSLDLDEEDQAANNKAIHKRAAEPFTYITKVSLAVTDSGGMKDIFRGDENVNKIGSPVRKECSIIESIACGYVENLLANYDKF